MYFFVLPIELFPCHCYHWHEVGVAQLSAMDAFAAAIEVNHTHFI